MVSWLAPIAFLPCLVYKCVSLGKVLGAPANLHYGCNTGFIVLGNVLMQLTKAFVAETSCN